MFAFTNKTLSLVIFLHKIMAFSFLFLFIFERERAEQVRGNTSGRGGPEGEGQVGSLSMGPDAGCDSRRSLNLSSFLKFFFLFGLDHFYYPILQITDLFFCSFSSAVVSLWCIFHCSYCILQLWMVLLCIFSFLKFSLNPSILLPSLLSIFMTITLNSLSGR